MDNPQNFILVTSFLANISDDIKTNRMQVWETCRESNHIFDMNLITYTKIVTFHSIYILLVLFKYKLLKLWRGMYTWNVEIILKASNFHSNNIVTFTALQF